MTAINIRAKYLNSKQNQLYSKKQYNTLSHSYPNQNIAFHISISPQDYYLDNILFSLLSVPEIENNEKNDQPSVCKYDFLTYDGNFWAGSHHIVLLYFVN